MHKLAIGEVEAYSIVVTLDSNPCQRCTFALGLNGIRERLNAKEIRSVIKEECNKERELAEQIVRETSCHLFLTGRAGTGKTTFLRELMNSCPKRMVVLAPTGIAAINAGGVTIHSFLQLPPGMHLPDQSYERSHFRFSKRKLKLIRSLDLIVIDEISMVRADLLDLIDRTLRRLRHSERPFGGLQILMIGDLQQLPPVTQEEEWQILSQYYETPYFFSAQVLKESPVLSVELQRVYRQSDSQFLSLLNEVRSGHISESTLEMLNSRYIPNFFPKPEEGYIRLCTHNHQAEQINRKEMQALQSSSLKYSAQLSGNYPEGAYPNALELELRVGAQVMFIKNGSSAGYSYYNGMLGEVMRLEEESVYVRSLDGGEVLCVGREVWSYLRYEIDEESRAITTIEEGRFEQIPLRPAWAITIHKSQGLTFDKAIVDVHAAFSHGQTYVALSRCRSLEGLVLSERVSSAAIIQDTSVRSYGEEVAERMPSNDDLKGLKQAYYLQLLEELFGFSRIEGELKRYVKLLQEQFFRHHPEEVEAYLDYSQGFVSRVSAVAESFALQYRAMLAEGVGVEQLLRLEERLIKGASYFAEQLQALERLLKREVLSTNNKEIKKRRDNIYEALSEELRIKLELLRYVAREGFELNAYLSARALAIVGEIEVDKKTSASKATRKTPSQPSKLSQATVEIKPKKEPQVSTLEQSYTLLSRGLSIEAVAQERGLKPNTIEGHVLDLVRAGRLSKDLYITSAEIAELQAYLATQTELTGLKGIYEGLEGRLSYFQLRLALEEQLRERRAALDLGVN